MNKKKKMGTCTVCKLVLTVAIASANATLQNVTQFKPYYEHVQRAANHHP